MITRVCRCFKRGYSIPSHFSNPSAAPRQYEQTPSSVLNPKNEKAPETHIQEPNQKQERNESSIKELTSILAMCALAYIAIDNYNNRIRLEKLNNDTSAINLKTLQLQQANFLNAKKKQDLAMVEERKETNKRDLKMGIHIALLRKQLKEAGIEPKGIDDAIKEYERSVRADSSVKHVSGQVLWLDDESSKYQDRDIFAPTNIVLKQYVPDAHEYDRKG